MVDAVLASGHANQIRARAAGRGQVLAVTQALPCVWHVEFGPATVVRIVFVWALAEVGHVVVRRDQHAGGARTHSSTSLGQAVLAGVAIHVTSLAVRHRSASQVGRPSPHGLSRVSHASDQTATGPAPLKLSLHATTSSLTTPSGHAQDSGQTTSPCRDSCLRLHSCEASAAAGVGAGGRARPVRLVVEAADVRDSSASPKIRAAIRSQRSWRSSRSAATLSGWPGRPLAHPRVVLPPRELSASVRAFAHRRKDLVGCETGAELRADMFAICGVDGRAGCGGSARRSRRQVAGRE